MTKNRDRPNRPRNCGNCRERLEKEQAAIGGRSSVLWQVETGLTSVTSRVRGRIDSRQISHNLILVNYFTKPLSAVRQNLGVVAEIKQIFALIQPEMDEVEATVLRQAETFDPAVRGYVAYACATSGKRLRPALALLAGGATGGASEPHRLLAVIIELIHLATLIHDDVLDGAEKRRDQPTANARWGNHISVLLGRLPVRARAGPRPRTLTTPK